MYNLEYLKIENLLSCKEAHIRIKNNKCIVISGENLTDSGFKNNGSGKSVILDAISIAIRNETIRDVPKIKFIRRGQKNCFIEAFFKNDVLNHNFLIRRKISKSSTVCELFENIEDIENIKEQEQNKDLVSVNEYNNEISRFLGLTNNDIFKYFIIGQGNYYSFFSANDTDKKDLLNRITSADIIKPLIQDLTLKEKQKVEDIKKDFDDKILVLESNNSFLKQEITKIEEESNFKERIEEYNTLIFEENKEIKNNSLEIKSKKIEVISSKNSKKLIKVDIGEIEILKNKIKDNDLKIKDLESQEDENHSLLKETEQILLGKIKCPFCEKEFSLESDIDISELEESLELLKENSLELQKEKDLKIKNRKSLRTEKENLEKKEDEISEIDLKISRLESKIKNLEKINEQKLKIIEDYNLEIKSFKENNSSLKKIKEIEESIEKNTEELSSLLDLKLNEVENLEDILFWKNKLGKTGFTTYLANKSIKIVEGMTNYFLEKMNTKLSVSIEPFKILQSEEVRDKIDIKVFESGIESGEFNGNSGGEKQRIIIAGILAIQKLLNVSTDGRGLNLICLDETLYYIDEEGMMKNINILNNIGRTILLITQNVNTDELTIENKIKVKKIKKISYYEERYN